MGFLHEQTKGMLTQDVRLVDSQNNLGETPLLRSIISGKIPIIKALLEDSSDPFIRDSFGNTVMIAAAKNSQLFCMFYLYDYIKSKYGLIRANNLLAQKDNEGHGPLEWAADSGDVNIIEYLLKLGLDPSLVDSSGRSSLYWAVKSNRVDAVRFLVRCGCSPHLKDTNRVSPYDLALSKNDVDLIKALNTTPSKGYLPHLSNIFTNLSSGVNLHEDKYLGVVNKRYERWSNAIPRKQMPNMYFLSVYTISILALWILSFEITFWQWLIIVIPLACVYKYLRDKVSPQKERANKARARILFSTWQRFIIAPESYLGLWAGCLLASFVYIISSLQYLHSLYYLSSPYNPSNMGALGYNMEDLDFLLIIFVSTIFMTIIWVKLVFITSDPGIIDTREIDFDEVLESSKKLLGAPNSREFCLTTMVKKPLRSKYCVQHKAVIARFDHYCIWLSTSIGDGNHRTFILFLLSQVVNSSMLAIYIIKALHTDFKNSSSCEISENLFSKNYFFPLTLCATLIFVSICLVCLTFEQLTNITINLTTNEKINEVRYEYLRDDNGNSTNKFDRRFISNILEFCRINGYAKDYKLSFDNFLFQDNSSIKSESSSLSTTSNIILEAT